MTSPTSSPISGCPGLSLGVQAFRIMGSMWPIDITASDPRFCALSLIGHAFDVAMMVSYKILVGGRCEPCLFATVRRKYGSADEGIHNHIVKAFEDGEGWRLVTKRNGVMYQTA